jgi:magnesium-dependent phosphatase-1
MKLIAFDGDHTLWAPLSGLNLSDRTPTDAVGWPHFTYRSLGNHPPLVERSDGARYAVRPEAHRVLRRLRERGVLVGLVSYNHEGNVRRILEAFGLSDLVDYVVAEWHTRKNEMLRKVLQQARQDGHALEAKDLMLVDDDPEGIYKGQCATMGVAFLCFGADIISLDEVLSAEC